MRPAMAPRIGRRLGGGHAPSQPADAEVVVRGAAGILGVQLGGQPQVRLGRELEPVRQDADDPVDPVLNSQLHGREVPRRGEVVFPVTVAGQQHRGGSDAAIVGREPASHHRANAQHREEVTRDEGHPGARRFGWTRDARNHVRVLRHRLEGAVLVAEVVEVRVGEARIRAAVVHFPDCHQAVRIRVRQRAQQHAVDHAEDRRRRPDAQGQRQDHGGAECGGLPQPPSGVSQIPQDRVEHVCSVPQRPAPRAGLLDGLSDERVATPSSGPARPGPTAALHRPEPGG